MAQSKSSNGTATRSGVNVFLIDYPLEQLPGAHLPSLHVLSTNFCHHRMHNATKTDSTQHVHEQLMSFRKNCYLLTWHKDDVVTITD
jgi:hypothetical protein